MLVPRLETIGYIERVSRSDYAHEENLCLIRSAVFRGHVCEESFEQYLTIVSLQDDQVLGVERRFPSRIELGSFYGAIVLYRIILYGKYTCEKWFDSLMITSIDKYSV